MNETATSQAPPRKWTDPVIFETDDTVPIREVQDESGLLKFEYNVFLKGPWAFWGGHKSGPNVASNPVGSFSAYREVMHSIMGHYGVSYEPLEVRILKFGGYHLQVHNSLTHFTNEAFTTEARHTLREYQYCWDVAYALKVLLVVNPYQYRPAPARGMLNRRLKAGRHWGKNPYFGRAECLIDEFRFITPEDDLTPVDLTVDLGIQPHGKDFMAPGKPWHFYPLVVNKGIVKYPTWKEVREFGLKRAQ